MVDDTEKDNVVPINQGKKSGSGKVSKNKIKQSIYEALSGRGCFAFDFPAKFVVVRQADGSRILHQQGGANELKIPSKDDAAHFLINYCHKMAKYDDRYLIDDKEAVTVLSTWTKTQETIPPPRVVAFKSDPGLSYRRLPFNPESGLTPTWEGLLDRMSNQRAFMCFIGSLFFEQSHGQQYLWLHSGGGDGKGAIGRWLSKVFKQAYYATAAVKSNGFWLYNLLGKRVCIFSDWDDEKFVTGGLFKSMVGGDAQVIEGKYRDPITANLPCKYIFFSNNRPNVDSNAADMRRLIYCQIKPIADEKKEYNAFEEKLWDESSAFIYECLKIYNEDCPTHGPIPFMNDESKALAEENEDHFQGLFDEFFCKGGMTPASEMSLWRERRKMTGKQSDDWKKFIIRHGAVYKVMNVRGKSVRFWCGLSLLNQVQREARSSVDI